MPKFRVYLSGYASGIAEVEAVDEEEAVEKAIDTMPKELCAGCSGWHRPWSMEIGTEWFPGDGDDDVVLLAKEMQVTPTA